ncbi:sigma-54-dependent Fis family transcriptional regulator, partial [Candidatus Poribacteria bacterium]|nr:sigma-54-dependent Fis family transcriptional regulator [Candidatus Poribacteria bacterium]
MGRTRVLICDDEPNLCLILSRSLRPLDVDTQVAHTLGEARRALEDDGVDILFLDIFLPDGNGLDALPEIHAQHPDVPVIILTAHGTMRTALEATKRHAFDYITKPFDVTQIQELARRAVTSVEEQAAAAGSQAAEFVSAPKAGEGDEIIGNSPLMQDVYKTVGRVTESDVTVLLAGECGTGKELVARAIHA